MSPDEHARRRIASIGEPVGCFTKAKARVITLQEAEFAAASLKAIRLAFFDAEGCKAAAVEMQQALEFLSYLRCVPDWVFELPANAHLVAEVGQA